MTTKLIWDLETNGLIPEVDTIWCLVMQDITTKEIYSYSDFDDNLPSLEEGLQKLLEADLIAGHNIIGYDLPVLKRLLGWEPRPSQTVWDTLLMSQLCMFQRTHRHGLAGWGEFFKYPKGDYNDWTNYNQEMLAYCIQDVTLNTKVYERLSREASIQIKARPQFKQALNLEHDFAIINAEITAKGWLFNMPKAKELKENLTWKLHAIEDELEPQLGSVCMLKGSKEVDKIVKKNGDYYKLITDWYDLDANTKASESFITGPFSRIEFSEVRLGQLAEVKKYLSDIGWKPDDWTFKKVRGKWIKMSPKLTDSSLEPLGIVGSMISDYYMLRQRLSMVDSWIEMVAKWGDGRLHGDMFTIGTPSFRCRHRGIVNIPGVHSQYGKDLRALLTCERGRRLVGADSAGNQFRGLAHYMGDDEFTASVVVGQESDGTDAHSRNAKILGISRTKAKSFIYAYLFGAGMSKLGEVITGLKSPKAGKEADAKFKAAFPKLKELKDSLSAEYNHNKMKTGIGFIIGADGRRVIVGSEHQLLNYLLQTLEGITCKSALVYQYKKIKELGIEGTYPILFYHDETAWVTPTKHAKTVLEISIAGFREGPKSVDVTCMDGDGKIGINYAEIH
jgi:DNA polymerase-1